MTWNGLERRSYDTERDERLRKAIADGLKEAAPDIGEAVYHAFIDKAHSSVGKTVLKWVWVGTIGALVTWIALSNKAPWK